jgi:hypothetical protein
MRKDTNSSTTPLTDYVAKLQAEAAAHAADNNATDQVCLKHHPRMMRTTKAKERVEKWQKKKKEQEEDEAMMMKKKEEEHKDKEEN